jgi:WD40 repeat protein/serine/threonine protein kinase
MTVAEVHPSDEELTAFTLGTLSDEAQASIEDHVATCTSCQERAAIAPGDSFVELVRSVRVHTSQEADTFVEAAAQVQTPTPLAPVAETEGLAPVVALCVSAESGRPEIPDAIPPELVGHARYRVVRLLGSGGMGVVFKAEHLVMQQPRALKVIRPAYMARADALDRFRREVHNAARLSHPNIVTTHDAEDAGETHFLVMEYIDGTDLGRLVQERGPLRVDRACDYVRQAALGLQYAFEQDMVHRDLKPHNLMLTPDGLVKILDFGLARFASEAAATTAGTASGLVLGTVDYIAPEQAENARQADIRSDIYSLGCTLYHLLAGHPPFPTGNPFQKMKAHVEKNPQPLTELRDDLPEELMPILERMMAKDPKNRYQTPLEVALALERFTTPTHVFPKGKPRPIAAKTDRGQKIVLEKSPARRRNGRRNVALAAALFFFVIGLLGAAVYRIATDKGELVITSESDDVKVVITQGGKQVDIIDAKTDKAIRLALRSGEYELELKGAPEGLKLDIKNAKLTRGETVLATITRTEVARTDNSGIALTERPAAKRPPDGVVAWWPGDGNAKDSVGDNHGELKGGVTFSPGIAGKAFRLDGATRFVEVPRSDRWGFGRRDFSIELWVQFRGVGVPSSDINPSAVFVGCDEGINDRNKWFFAYRAEELWFFVANPRTQRDHLVVARAPFSPDLDQWYHLAVTRNRGTFTIYVNGAPAASRTTDVIIPNPDAPLTIGQAEGTFFLNGLIDEIAIYDRALSPDEVKARWSALAPSTKPVAEKFGQVVRRFPLHQGGSASVAISPDGRLAATGDGPGTEPAWSVRLWDMADGHEIRRFAGHGADVQCVAFSPDGKLLASTGSHDQTVRIWEVATGKELHCLRGHNARVERVAFLPDGRHVVSGGFDGSLRMWDIKTGKEVRKFEHKGNVAGVAVSPDGRLIASGSDRTARLWETESGNQQRQFPGHKGNVYSLAFSPDGRWLLSADSDANLLRLWDVQSGKELRQFVGHTGPVWNLVFTPDGRRALSSGGGTIRLWDVETGKELHCFKEPGNFLAVSPDGWYVLYGDANGAVLMRLPDPPPAEKVGEVRRFRGHEACVHSVAISPDGKLAASGSGGIWTPHDWIEAPDYSVRLWDMASGREIRRFEGHGSAVTGLAFSPDGNLLASAGSHDRTARIWEVATGKQLKCLRHNSFVNRVAFVLDGGLVVSGAHEGLLAWDVKSGEQVSKFEGGAGLVTASSDGRRIASGGADNTVRVWDVETHKELRQFTGHTYSLDSVAFSPDGRRLLTADQSKVFRLWDVDRGTELRQFVGHTDAVRSVIFTKDGRRALSGSFDESIRLWDVETGKELHRFTGHTSGVFRIALSPDGRYVLSGSNDKTVRLWRLPDPPPAEKVGEVRRFEGHTKGAWGVAFSPDGRHALSGDGDGTVRLWEVATGREVRRFSGHNGHVEGVAFSPDGRQALTTSYGGTVQLWDVETGKEIRVLRGHPDDAYRVAFSPDGRRALSGGDETMRLWDLESANELRQFAGGVGVAFSPDGRQALSGSNSKAMVRLWDLETGAGLRELPGHNGCVTSVVFLPGGRQALSCSHDRTLRLWDLDGGKEIRCISGHTGWVQNVAITQDGRFCLSGSDDKTVRLWDLQTGKELHCFIGHTEPVRGVAISPDGKFGLSGSADNTVRLWRLPDLPPVKESP